jgi:hypothetical protein
MCMSCPRPSQALDTAPISKYIMQLIVRRTRCAVGVEFRSVRGPSSNIISPPGTFTFLDLIQPPVSSPASNMVTLLLGNSLDTKYALASPATPPPSTAMRSGYAVEDEYRLRMHREEVAGRSGRRATCLNVDSRSETWHLSRIAGSRERGMRRGVASHAGHFAGP